MAHDTHATPTLLHMRCAIRCRCAMPRPPLCIAAAAAAGAPSTSTTPALGGPTAAPADAPPSSSQHPHGGRQLDAQHTSNVGVGSILDVLRSRGLVAEVTGEADMAAAAAAGPLRVYCGFDPTADRSAGAGRGCGGGGTTLNPETPRVRENPKP